MLIDLEHNRNRKRKFIYFCIKKLVVSLYYVQTCEGHYRKTLITELKRSNVKSS
jgi:hypothetical protein